MPARSLSKILLAAMLAGLLGESPAGAAQGAPFDDAIAHVRTQSPARRATALAADVSQEGHWTFVNAEGERYTAASPDELKRAIPTLASEAAKPGARLLLVVSEDTIFRFRQQLAALPFATAPSTELVTSIGSQTYPVLRRGNQFFAATKPGLAIELTERRLFDEALWQLAHPLRRDSVRIVGVEPGGPTSITLSPALDSQTKRPLTDHIAPGSLASAIRSLRAQTVVLTARRDGNLLAFRPSSGPELTLPTAEIENAAEAADVNLLVLQAATPRQPGTRSWLWQRVSVSRLDDAVARDHLADFLTALTPGEDRLLVSLTGDGDGRRRMTAALLSATDQKRSITGTLSDMVSSISGQVTVTGVEASLRAQERQAELDRRLVPWLPSWLQFGYLALLGLGLVGHRVSKVWWHKLWPPEQRTAYANSFGYQSARALRAILYAGIYLPVTALASAPLALTRWRRVRAES